MTVRFLQDYRGWLTEERFFVAGQEAEFPAEQAAALVEAGRAEATTPRARFDVSAHTVAEVLAAVEANSIGAAEALAQEEAGETRVTLLRALRERLEAGQ